MLYIAISFAIVVVLARSLTLRPRTFAVCALFLLILLNIINYAPIGWLGSGLRVGHARLPLLLFALLWLLISFRGRLPLAPARNLDVLAFAFWAVASTLTSVTAESALLYSAWLALSLAFLLVVLALFPDPTHLLQATGVTFLVCYSAALAVGLVNLPAYIAGAARLEAALDVDQVHAWGAAIVVGTVLALWKVNESTGATRGRARWIIGGGVLIVAAFTDLVLSGTRSALLAATVTLVFYIVVNWRRTQGVMRALPVVVVGVILAQTFISQGTLERYTTFFVTGQFTTGDAVRMKLLEAHWEYAASHPILGGGLVSVDDEIGRDHPNLDGYSSHNTYVGILSALGFVGGMLFLIIVFRSGIMLLREPRLRPYRSAMVLLVLPPMVISIFEYNLTPGQALFFPLWLGILMPRCVAPTRMGGRRASHALDTRTRSALASAGTGSESRSPHGTLAG